MLSANTISGLVFECGDLCFPAVNSFHETPERFSEHVSNIFPPGTKKSRTARIFSNK